MIKLPELPADKSSGDRLSATDVNLIVDALRIILRNDPSIRKILDADSAVTAQWVWATNVGELGINPLHPVGIVSLSTGPESNTDQLTTEIILRVVNPKESTTNFEGHYAVAAESILPKQVGRVWISGICPVWGLAPGRALLGQGTMASYTSGSQITVTLNSGFSVQDGDTVYMIWSEDKIAKARSAATVSLSGSTMTLTGGSGDPYPDNVGLSMSVRGAEVQETYAELIHQGTEDSPAPGKDYLTCSTGGSTRLIWKKEDSEFAQLVMIRLGFASIMVTPAEIVPVKITSKVDFNTYLGDEYGDGIDEGATLADVTVRVLQIGSTQTIPNDTYFPAWLQKWGGVLTRTVDVARDY